MRCFHLPRVMFAAALVLATLQPGCKSKSTSNETPFEKILATFQGGDKTAAVQSFIDSDWNDSPAFRDTSPMCSKESDFASMTNENMERLMKDVHSQTNPIRMLAKMASEKCKAGTDPKQTQRCNVKLKYLGEQLNRPDGLKVVQLIGKAIQQLAS